MTDAPLAPDEFISRLRAQGGRYHNLHPFHRRMDAGELDRDELQRWVTNRFYYQKCIPLKDAAIMASTTVLVTVLIVPWISGVRS